MSTGKQLKDSIKTMRLLGASDEQVYMDLIATRDREARLQGSTFDRDDVRYAIWKLYVNSNLLEFRASRILSELQLIRVLLMALAALAAISVAAQFVGGS